MSISLQKGKALTLDKQRHALSKLTIGCGWDVRQQSPGLFASILRSAPVAEFDLDIAALLLDDTGKCADVDEDFVYFNRMTDATYAVELSDDNRDGAGEGDDEQIHVDIEGLYSGVQQIVFFVAIYQGNARGQRFGQVANAYIRALDENGTEIARYSLSGSDFKDMCALEFARLVRAGEDWQFHAVGRGHRSDQFGDLIEPFL